MPSLLDQLVGDDVAPASKPTPPADLVRSVKAEGLRRRMARRRRKIVFAVLGVGLVAIPTAVLRPGPAGPGPNLSVAAGVGSVPEIQPLSEPSKSVPDSVPPGPGTTSPTVLVPGPPAPTTLPAPQPGVAPSTAPPRTTGPVTDPTAPSTPTTASCRNSVDPRCGPFRWDPAPSPNQPLVASFTDPPSTAVAGQTLSLPVAYSDADARLTYVDITTDGTALASPCSLAARSGPWTPPPVEAASGIVPFVVTFPKPGTFQVTAVVATADCSSPYASEKVVTTTVTVTPAA